MRALVALAVLTLTGVPTAAQQANPRRDSLIARAKALELNTAYVPPPGTALEHDAAGFPHILCSAVFTTPPAPAFPAQNVRSLTRPSPPPAQVAQPHPDPAANTPR